MRQLEAMRETMKVVEERAEYDVARDVPESLALPHLRDMLARIEAAQVSDKPFSPAKLGRWLGWLQCACTGLGYLTLEDAKSINLRHADGEDGDGDDAFVVSWAKLRQFIQTAVKVRPETADLIIKLDLAP